jgi:hypothetical protein
MHNTHEQHLDRIEESSQRIEDDLQEKADHSDLEHESSQRVSEIVSKMENLLSGFTEIESKLDNLESTLKERLGSDSEVQERILRQVKDLEVALTNAESPRDESRGLRQA